MQHTAFQGQAQQAPKSSAAIAGLGAAFVASALTVAILMSNPSPAAMPEQAAATTNACQRAPLMLLVSTTTGSGTVRFREGDYLSPPITLSSKPQLVTFPRPRPETGFLEETMTIEGNATDVVTTSPVTNYRNVFQNVNGVLAYKAKWVAKTC
jgi:hypothetical protein